jgi:hypothetical protein
MSRRRAQSSATRISSSRAGITISAGSIASKRRLYVGR